MQQGLAVEASSILREALSAGKVPAGTRWRLVKEYAAACQAAGDTANAHRILTVELAALKQDDDGIARRALRQELANLLIRIGDYEKAETLYEEVLKSHRDAGDTMSLDFASALHNRAMLYGLLGDRRSAQQLLKEDLAITEAAAGVNSLAAAHSQSTLALFYTRDRQFDAARSAFAKCLPIIESELGTRDPLYTQTLTNFGYLHLQAGELDKAETLLTESLELRRETVGEEHIDFLDSLRDLADVHVAKGNPKDALPLLRQVNDIAQQHLQLASFTQSERQQLAMSAAFRKHLDRYLSIAIATKADAESAYDSMLKWKGAVFARQRCMRLARTQPSYRETFSRMREVCSELASLSLNPPSPEEQPQWRERIAQLNDRKDRLESSVAASRSAPAPLWAQYAPAPFLRSSGRAQLSDLAAVRRSIGEQSALIDFIEFSTSYDNDPLKADRCLAAFVIRPSSEVQLIDLGSVAPIKTALDQWLRTLHRTQPVQTEDDPAIELHSLLWARIEPLLKDVKVVYISPDGVTGRVPFLALPSHDPKRYLIEDYAISIVPVPQTLSTFRKEPIFEPSLVALGAVDFQTAASSARQDTHLAARGGGMKEWEELPATRAEIVAIRDSFETAFPEGKAVLLRGNAATEESFAREAEKASFLHLATHGFFSPPELISLGTTESQELASRGLAVLPLRIHPGVMSGLVLAGANQASPKLGSDGILTAIEVAELDLTRVQLATLSACETSLGEAEAGEGLIGLQRAFQMAGAKTTIGSLWKVSDQSTQSLMTKFYENLWTKKLATSEALRQAQLAMLNDPSRGLVRVGANQEPTGRTPPLHWAAFTVSGGLE